MNRVGHWLWPWAASGYLAEHKPAGAYPLPFELWLLWHYHFRVKGEGFRPLSAEDAARLLAPEAS